MLSFWYKNFSHIPRHHGDFHRAKLIYHLLLFVCILAGVVTALNLFLFDAKEIAFIDAIGLTLSLCIYWYFRKTGNVKVAGWAVTILFITIIWAFLTVWSGNNYGIVWATLIPPVAFFLLGRSMGTLVSIVFFSYATYIVYGHVQAGLTYQLSLGGVLNVIEVLIAHIMLFRFYERTRADAMLQLQQNREQLEIIANTDKLTGLNNRQRFDQQLHKYVVDAERKQQPFALLLVDIDHFKRVNDQFGHLFGDSVLQSLATYLQQNLRSEDFLARWGGEEFAVLMPNTSSRQAYQLAERLRELIADTPICEHEVTFSGGIAVWRPGYDAETLLGHADKALYKAKDNGRNRIEMYT
ncbi:diguanylate cyclase (GGDEF)-like protein [Idiomarina aquatica]|uniref:diguanylate cyclase n=1 Tax=Idiomarina aquatica TaxID=1327752 RepID=A0A4V3CPJ4_9GAMM|nr:MULTISPECIES: diguanylate cyclase [Idiomarina]TDP38182.1 diguanylate cyclase (GGDEF)-like protein [Idiomarina aquatica]